MLRFAKVKLTSLATGARALLAQLRGLGPEADDAASEPYDDAELLQPMGLICRPVRSDTLQALVFELSEDLVGLLLRDKGQPAFTGLNEGDTMLYAAGDGTVKILLRASGRIEITAKAGSDIVHNGGSLEVARRTDPVAPTALMTTWMTQVSGYINGLVPGTVTPPTPLSFGAISAGAANVKA
jgi:phage gp45-like